jgi:protein gp37
MAENSKIQWTDHTFNPWIGCTKVSPGCAHCYAEELMDTRYGKVKWGKGQKRQRTSAANWKLPLKWNRLAAFTNRPRVFCASLADWLDDEVPIEWLADLLKLIHDTPNLDWLLLTKRPENWADRLELVDVLTAKTLNGTGWPERLWHWRYDGTPLDNAWIGTTVENQEYADKRIPELLNIPAKVRFLSVEPMLGPVNLMGVRDPKTRSTRSGYLSTAICASDSGGLYERPPLDWIICGGESGKDARLMEIEWAHSLRNQCKAAGVAFFMKQLGGTRDKRGDIEQFPKELQVREFPICSP